MKSSSITSKIKLVSLLFTLTFCFPIKAFSQSLLGDWHALLEVPGASLKLKFSFEEGPEGWTGTMSVPQQNANNLPLKEVLFNGQNLSFKLPAARISFEGTWNTETSVWEGTFTQGMAFPLVLQRKEVEILKPKRPQVPQAPFPYAVEEVFIEQKKEQFQIGATLTMPKTGGSHAVVVLISGSGQQDRNSEIFDHKPFWVIADYLSRNGFAVLRYDDRGVGETGGNVQNATSLDFSEDTRAVVQYLKTRKDINPKHIFLAGHSEGGILALMAAQNNADVAGIISLAGLGIPGHELLLKQSYLIAQATGVSGPQLALAQQTNKAIYDLILKDTPEDNLRSEVSRLFKESGLITDENLIAQQFQMINSPWFKYFVKFDPAPYLATLKKPILILNGEKDLQVPAQSNTEGFRKAFESSGHKKFDIKLYPNLNHLFQTAKTGLVDEYAKIEETFNEEVLADMKSWLEKQTRKK